MSYKRFKYFRISKSKKIRFLSKKTTSKICVVFLHGFMSDIEGQKPSTFARFCSKRKINFLTLEYSGHGKSYGKFLKGNISKWTKDAFNTINAKMKNKDLKNNIYIYVYIYIYIYICVCVCMCACLRAYTRAYAYACVSTRR